MKYKNIVCKECGKNEELHWIKECNERLEKRKLCFSCDHWYSLYLKRNSKSVARIGGKHFIISNDNDTSPFRGFGGMQFKITFKDGRKVTTSNLWHQGDIPGLWRERLPDNATSDKITGNPQ